MGSIRLVETRAITRRHAVQSKQEAKNRVVTRGFVEVCSNTAGLTCL